MTIDPKAKRYSKVSLKPSKIAGSARVSVCKDCGAIVYDTSVHDEWHELVPRWIRALEASK